MVVTDINTDSKILNVTSWLYKISKLPKTIVILYTIVKRGKLNVIHLSN